MNKGPWSDLDLHAPFLPGIEPKPPQGNFYPLDATRDEVAAWFKTLEPAQKEAAAGFFTVSRRNAQRQLIAVPYASEYQSELTEMSRLLHEAAALMTQATLKAFLDKPIFAIAR